MSGSISAKQIFVLFNAKLKPVDIYDIPGIITSCFFLSPKALIDKIKASVPVAQPTEYFTLTNLENAIKNYRLKSNEKKIDIFLHPELIEYINDNIKIFKTNFLWKNFVLINIKPDKTLYKHQFKMYSVNKKEYINYEQF